MELSNFTIEACERAITIADKDGYVEVLGFGTIHIDNFKTRIQYLKSLPSKKIHCDSVIKLGISDVEVSELTAGVSIKFLIIHNNKLRKERDEAIAALDKYLETPSVRGMSQKINALLNERGFLYGIIRQLKLKNIITDENIKSIKGSGKLSDIVDASLNRKQRRKKN